MNGHFIEISLNPDYVALSNKPELVRFTHQKVDEDGSLKFLTKLLTGKPVMVGAIHGFTGQSHAKHICLTSVYQRLAWCQNAVLILLLLILNTVAVAQTLTASKACIQNRDLNLPEWGPYSKDYAGISHIANLSQGIRFDLSVFPSKPGSAPRLPKVSETTKAFYPRMSLPSYDFWTFRHYLPNNDKAYADVSYLTLDDATRLIRVGCVNNGDSIQPMNLNFAASLHFPNVRENAEDYLLQDMPVLPQGAVWYDAENYDSMDFVPESSEHELASRQIKTNRPSSVAPSDLSHRFLQDDGRNRGEVRDNGWVSGAAIVFGRHPGDHLKMSFNATDPIANAALVFRVTGKAECETHLDGQSSAKLNFTRNGSVGLYVWNVGMVNRGRHTLILDECKGMAEIDGFVLCHAADIYKISFQPKQWNPTPIISQGPASNSVVLKYDATPVYGFRCLFSSRLQISSGSDLAALVSARSPDDSAKTGGNRRDYYTAATLPDIQLLPNSTQVVYAVVCSGTDASVRKALEVRQSFGDFERLYVKKQEQAVSQFNCLSDGEKYRFSQEILGATILANVTFPLYGDRRYVRAFTPGKTWDSFYTWDSGMIGIGLGELSIPLSTELLETYLCEPGSQSAFLHHGSLVPTQIYQLQELWNRTQSRELLASVYPKLKYYYQFMSGHLETSTLNRVHSDLLTPWDYFYNSGGWDDYPPQVYIHSNHLERVCAPVVTTAQVIRMAKILSQAAGQLGLSDDVRNYAGDIDRFTRALQHYAWDPQSGYYSYVLHDTDGNPKGILRTAKGENFDMGLDGVCPLIAGICSGEQRARLLEHLSTPGQIWSPVGLSTVDQRASYFKTDGYWNGSVWFPYQWMIWKTMLDLGEEQFADKIAFTALDVFENGVKKTGGSFEFCKIKTGQAGGWSHFSGLSSVILNWFSAYFRPGTIESGFDLWITKWSFSKNNARLTLDFNLPEPSSERKSSILICLNPSHQYEIRLNGKPIASRVLRPGSLYINVPWIRTENHISIIAH